MIRIFLFLLALLGAAQAQPIGPQTLPPNTFVGRMGSSVAGPAQAIPFSQLQSLVLPIQNQFYVCNQADGLNCTGAGTDTGTCASWATACLTITYTTGVAQAANVAGVAAVNLGLGPATGNVLSQINIGGGTFNESVVVFNCPLNSGSITGFPLVCIMFNGAGSSHTTWNGGGDCGTLISEGSSVVGVENMTMKGNANGCQSTLFADRGGKIDTFNGLVFGAATIEQFHAENSGSIIEVWAGYTVNGGGSTHWTVATNGLIIQSCQAWATTCVITVSGSPTFTGSFMFGDANGSIYMNTIASSLFSGSITTGKKYILQGNTVIQSGGACSSIPGTGTTTGTGGVCE